MKRYRVVIPPIVQDQIRAQVFHIAQDSIDNALAWEDRLRTAIQELSALPTRNPVDFGASTRLGRQVRKMVFERTYLIFYHIDQSRFRIDILNFRHGARLRHSGG